MMQYEFNSGIYRFHDCYCENRYLTRCIVYKRQNRLRLYKKSSPEMRRRIIFAPVSDNSSALVGACGAETVYPRRFLAPVGVMQLSYPYPMISTFCPAETVSAIPGLNFFTVSGVVA